MNNKTINCTVLSIIGNPLVERDDTMTQDKLVSGDVDDLRQDRLWFPLIC
jgi:hypothetical protein